MAARENTYIHAALILMVMALIGTGGLSYYFAQQAKIQLSKSNEANNKLQDMTTQLQTEQFKTALLRHMLGDAAISEAQIEDLKRNFGEDSYADVKKLEDQFKQDMADNGFGLPQDSLRTYRDLLKIVREAQQKIRASYDEQLERNNTLEKNLASTVTEKDKNKQDYDSAVQERQTSLTAAIAQRDQENARKEKERTAMLASHQKQTADLRQANDAIKGQITALEQKSTTQQNTIIAQKEIIAEKEAETFEVADGRVAGVDLKKGRVYINLGLADGLRKGQNFSVYEPKSNGILRNINEQKAKIEVIEVIDQRFSACKISEDILNDPVGIGDQIHTPAWKPGIKVRFALLGGYDINGDGVDDRQLVRSLIAANNGVIDAELAEDGTMTGKITPRTRYIIKGDVPADVAKAEGYGRFMDAARYNGVRQITQDEFVGFMGWAEETRTISLGRNARSSDFRKKRNLQSTDQPGNVFRNRQPPKRGDNGAF